MRYNTKFGKTIEISIEEYLSMTDDELARREEHEGTALYPFDPLYVPIGDSTDNYLIDDFSEFKEETD